MKDMPLDWNDLKVLLALSRRSSFSAAARSLKVDQSTVSRRLASMERAVGFQILIRGSRDYSWTGIGKKLVEAAAKAESAIHAAQQQVRSELQAPMGTVRVVLPPGLVAWLSPYLTDIPMETANIHYSFAECMEPLDDVYASTDVVIRYTAPMLGDLISQFICTEEFALYASKSHIAIYGLPHSVEALSARPLVACDLAQIAALQQWSKLISQFGLSDSVTVVENLQSAEQLISLGYGLGVLPKSQAQCNGLLQRVDLMSFEGQAIYLSYHVSLKKSARVQVATRQLRHALESMVEASPASKAANNSQMAYLGTTCHPVDVG